MRLLIVSSEFPPGPGGIGQHAHSLAQALHHEGYDDIEVLTPGDYADKRDVEDFDRKQPYIIIRYPREGALSTYWKRVLVTYSRVKLKPRNTTIILTGKFSLWQGLIIKVLFRQVRTLVILHGSEVNLSSWILRQLTHASIAVADVIIPVSKFTLSLLPERIRCHHRYIKIIPNGVDGDFYIDKDLQLESLEGYPRLLTVGHVTPRKGQHRVIRALPYLLEKYPNLHYHIVGRPHSMQQLTALAESLNVRSHITFHGRIPEHKALSAYYRQADVFMLLSENQSDGDVEGFGIVALEANMYGLPVVGAKHCGVEEAVNHLQSGYLVDGNNPEEILEGIEYCINNNETLEKGAQSWVENHNWSIIVKQYVELLRQAQV